MEAQAINGKYDLFETLLETSRLENRIFDRGFLLGRTVDSLQLEGTRFTLFQSLDSSYRNLRAVKTRFDRCDFTCTTFLGGYFRNVDFTDCTFRGVTFADCVFDQCRLGPKDGATFERCLFFEAEVRAVILAPVTDAKAPPVAAPAAPDPAEEIAGRFGSLER